MTLFPRLSIRWRITLGSLLIAALFFSVAAAAFRAQVGTILTSTTKTLLEHDAAPITAEIQSGSVTLDVPGRGQLVSAVDPSGTVVRSSLPEDLASRLRELLRLTDVPREFTTDDGHYLILTHSVQGTSTTGEVGTWFVVTARNLESSELLMEQFTTTLVVAAIGLAIGFGFASWLLTGAALRPVSKMQNYASELSRSGSTVHLPVGPAKDELAALAKTLNEFIDSVRSGTARERQMVSDASHELRSPVAVLKTQLELAHLNSGDAVALEAEITAAQQSVERIASLATELLELSEVELTPGGGESTWEDLSTELGTATDRARLAAARHEVTVDFRASGENSAVSYPITVARFGRVLDNLCTNSVNAMVNGGTLELSLQQRANSLELRVTDDGPGVPEEFLAVAFNRFSRPDVARSGSDGGSGLGLAIVKAVVAGARGQVSLANQPGAGLEVTVTIPSVDAAP